MARPGEVWLLDSLKQTKDFRCNMGFAEFEGSEAEVTVILFDTDGASLFFLASKQYSVPEFGQFQVNKGSARAEMYEIKKTMKVYMYSAPRQLIGDKLKRANQQKR